MSGSEHKSDSGDGGESYEFVVPPFLADPNSSSNTSEARVSHMHMELSADFSTKTLTGFVDLTVLAMADGAEHVCLDAKALALEKCIEKSSGKPLKYSLEQLAGDFGSKMSVELPDACSAKGSSCVIRISYSTSPNSSGIQWLPPAQTKGGKHPYLFTQHQAIHARAFVPCQDTPSNKCPYTAKMTVPSPLVALMSARSTGKEMSSPEATTVTYSFHQPVPMPSYLIALAIGALEKRDISERCAVWSEKEMVEAGAHEFAETEVFLKAAEDICGPYVWGRYDILLLPPSFPYGGMENPCLTFVTPTLLAGDRSLATVVAHEIAHSWMGNLVTSQTWEHFWMNEGFTVFVERKIVRRVFNAKQQALHAHSGFLTLQRSVEQFGHDHAYTCLHVKLAGVDPDDAFSSVPYEKGFNFLWHLQDLVGGEEVMDAFLKAHCQRFKFSCVSEKVWRDFFLSYFQNKVDAKVLDSIDWDTWLEKPGMPPVDPRKAFDTSLLDQAAALAQAVVKANGAMDAESTKEYSSWHTAQRKLFLENLEAEKNKQLEAGVPKEEFCKTLVALDKVLNLTASTNSELMFRWFMICISVGLESVLEPAVAFVTAQGRMKFVRPLYRALFAAGDQGKQLAVETFKKHRQFYHSIASKMISKDLGL